MAFKEIIKNVFWFILAMTIIGAVFAGGFVGFMWVLGLVLG